MSNVGLKKQDVSLVMINDPGGMTALSTAVTALYLSPLCLFPSF